MRPGPLGSGPHTRLGPIWACVPHGPPPGWLAMFGYVCLCVWATFVTRGNFGESWECGCCELLCIRTSTFGYVYACPLDRNMTP